MFFGYIKLKIRSWNKLPLPGVIAPGSFPLHRVTPGVTHPDQRYDARNIRRVNFGFNHSHVGGQLIAAATVVRSAS